MLTGSASLLQQPGGPARNTTHGVPMQALDDRFFQLARTFELASGETTVSLSAMCQMSACHLSLSASFQMWACLRSRQLGQMSVMHS